jgi:hypothetical protein
MYAKTAATMQMSSASQVASLVGMQQAENAWSAASIQAGWAAENTYVGAATAAKASATTQIAASRSISAALTQMIAPLFAVIGVVKILGEVNKGIQDSMMEAQAFVRLSTVVQNLGMDVKATTEEVKWFADEQKRVYGIDEDQTLPMMQRMLTARIKLTDAEYLAQLSSRAFIGLGTQEGEVSQAVVMALNGRTRELVMMAAQLGIDARQGRDLNDVLYDFDEVLGDGSDIMDTAAQRQRMMKFHMDEMWKTLGEKLTPAFTFAMGVVAEFGLIIKGTGENVSRVVVFLGKVIPQLAELMNPANWIHPKDMEIFYDNAKFYVTQFLKDTREAVKGTIAEFDRINALAQGVGAGQGSILGLSPDLGRGIKMPGKEGDNAANAAKEAADALLRIHSDLLNEEARLTQTEAEYEKTVIRQKCLAITTTEGIKWADIKLAQQNAIDAIRAVDDKVAKENADKQKELLDERLKALAEFNTAYARLTMGDTEFALRQMDIQAQAYAEQGIDKVRIAEWVAAQEAQISGTALEKQRTAWERQMSEIRSGANTILSGLSNVYSVFGANAIRTAHTVSGAITREGQAALDAFGVAATNTVGIITEGVNAALDAATGNWLGLVGDVLSIFTWIGKALGNKPGESTAGASTATGSATGYASGSVPGSTTVNASTVTYYDQRSLTVQGNVYGISDLKGMWENFTKDRAFAAGAAVRG